MGTYYLYTKNKEMNGFLLWGIVSKQNNLMIFIIDGSRLSICNRGTIFASDEPISGEKK